MARTFGTRPARRACTILVAGTAAVSLAFGAAAASAEGHDAGEQPSVEPHVVEAADTQMTELAASLQSTLETAYIEEKPAEATELAEAPLNTSSEGAASIEEVEEGIQIEASGLLDSPSWEQTIDAVTVQVASPVEVTSNDDGTVSAIADMEITRHIAEDGIDWVELTPYELVLNEDTSQVVELIPHDTEYQQEAAGEEPLPDEELMNASQEVSAGADVSSAALSAANRQKVADYALKYAINRNKAYKDHKQDCTNFVSQAMRAGGWGFKTHPWVDYKQDDAWWYGGVPTWSYTWGGAENFYRMTKALKRTTLHSTVWNLRVGDILQYKAKGQKVMTHSMIVTVRNSKTIYLSYHTGNTKNKPLESVLANKGGFLWYAHKV